MRARERPALAPTPLLQPQSCRPRAPHPACESVRQSPPLPCAAPRTRGSQPNPLRRRPARNPRPAFRRGFWRARTRAAPPARAQHPNARRACRARARRARATACTESRVEGCCGGWPRLPPARHAPPVLRRETGICTACCVLRRNAARRRPARVELRWCVTPLPRAGGGPRGLRGAGPAGLRAAVSRSARTRSSGARARGAPARTQAAPAPGSTTREGSACSSSTCAAAACEQRQAQRPPGLGRSAPREQPQHSLCRNRPRHHAVRWGLVGAGAREGGASVTRAQAGAGGGARRRRAGGDARGPALAGGRGAGGRRRRAARPGAPPPTARPLLGRAHCWRRRRRRRRGAAAAARAAGRRGARAPCASPPPPRGRAGRPAPRRNPLRRPLQQLRRPATPRRPPPPPPARSTRL